jgi:hypothetical protein
VAQVHGIPPAFARYAEASEGWRAVASSAKAGNPIVDASFGPASHCSRV